MAGIANRKPFAANLPQAGSIRTTSGAQSAQQQYTSALLPSGHTLASGPGIGARGPELSVFQREDLDIRSAEPLETGATNGLDGSLGKRQVPHVELGAAHRTFNQFVARAADKRVEEVTGSRGETEARAPGCCRRSGGIGQKDRGDHSARPMVASALRSPGNPAPR